MWQTTKKRQYSALYKNKTCGCRKLKEALQGFSSCTQAIRKYRHQFIEYFTGVSLSCHCRSNGHTTQTKAKKCVEGRVIIIYKHSCIYGLTPLSQAVSFGHKIFPRFWGCSNVVRSSPDQGLHSSSVREWWIFHIMNDLNPEFVPRLLWITLLSYEEISINDELISYQHSSTAGSRV